MAGVAAGCGGERSAEAPDDAPPPTAALCGDVRPTLGCRELRVGNRTYRYSLQRSSGRGAAAVLVDLGGPGRTLFGGDDLLAFARTWPTAEALLFVEEPWVLEPTTAACEAALSTFYRALRAGDGSAKAGRLADTCGLDTPGRWGWTPGTYARVVGAIAAAEKLELVGVVGTSYGAVRTSIVAKRSSVDWLILNSPAAATLSGGQYVEARRAGILAALARSCPSCGNAQGGLRLADRAATALAARPVELETRTPRVEPIDVAAALVGLTHLPPTQRAAVAAALEHPVGAAAARLLGELSDATLLRYGEYQQSPAMLAYFDEVCRAYRPWTEGFDDIVGRFLEDLHSPCRHVDAVPSRPAKAPPAACIARGGEDFVTPASFTATWRQLLPHALHVNRPAALHGTPDLARACRLALAAAD